MKNVKDNSIKGSAINAGLLIISLIVFIGPTILGEFLPIIRQNFSGTERLALILLALIAFLLPVTFRIMNIALSLYQNKRDNELCPITGEGLCCVQSYADELIETGNGRVEINNNKFLDFHKLTLESTIIDEEREFGINIPLEAAREIWVFSYNLDTEIRGDFSQNVASANVNSGIKYVYFYVNNTRELEKTKCNIEKIKSCVNPSSVDNLTFIPLNENTDDGIDIIARVIGSIIFVSPTESNLHKAYFSLRGNKLGALDKPIYFRLPACMNSKYYDYFEKRKNEHENSCANKS
jgi:hypothetical protein